MVSIHISQTINEFPFQPFWVAASPLGALSVSFGISLSDFTAAVKHRCPRAQILFNHAPHPALDQISEYLNGDRRIFSTQLDLSRATPFQRRVYQAVMEIPFGETRTYGQIARQLGNPNAARAVGAANRANPLPILIPCHRLVGSDGSLRGYGGGGGIATKARLLVLEKRTQYPEHLG